MLYAATPTTLELIVEQLFSSTEENEDTEKGKIMTVKNASIGRPTSKKKGLDLSHLPDISTIMPIKPGKTVRG